MDYLKIFNEDIAFNAANPRYRNDASDDEYGGAAMVFGLKIQKRTIFVLHLTTGIYLS